MAKDAKQVRVKTMEHGRVHAQLEEFPVPDPDRPTGRRVKHLVLQPETGGAAHRYPLDDPEAQRFLEDYPDLRQLLDEPEPAEDAGQTPPTRPRKA